MTHLLLECSNSKVRLTELNAPLFRLIDQSGIYYNNKDAKSGNLIVQPHSTSLNGSKGQLLGAI